MARLPLTNVIIEDNVGMNVRIDEALIFRRDDSRFDRFQIVLGPE